jgi:enediyne biosynthesis protein E4
MKIKCLYASLWIIGLFVFGNRDVLSQTIKFTDVSKSMQVQGLKIGEVYKLGHGIACADINLDGLPDFYVSNANEVTTAISFPEVLYISHTTGAYTEEANGARGVYDSNGIGSHGVTFFDMDNDGDFDLFNGNTGQTPIFPTVYNHLYRNRGDGLFKDISKTAGVQEVESFARTVVAFDANRDGLIDIYSVGADPANYKAVRNHFYINQGNEQFKLVDLGASFINEDGYGPNGVTVADFDDDGDDEIYICRVDRQYSGARSANQLLDRQPNGEYQVRWDLKISGRGWSDGAAFADYDNDGDLDLFVSSSNDRQWVKVCIYENNGDGTFLDRTEEKAIYQRGFTPVLFDVDNDGDLDLFTPSVSKAMALMHLYLNDGHGNFTVIDKTGLEVSIYDTRGVSVADIENDGDLDIYLTDTNKGSDPQYYNRMLRNDLISTNRWIKFLGRGSKGDMGAFGSKIWLYENGHLDDPAYLIGHKQIISNYGFCSQNDPVQHFGVGARDTVAAKIRLTDGTILKMDKLATKQRVYFSRPARMEKTSGDGQTAGRGHELPLPLKVTVYDAYGKLAKGAAVEFLAGDGTVVESQPVYTDNEGVAQVHYIVGTLKANQTITVRAPWLSGTELNFGVTMTIIPKEMKLLSQANPYGFAGSLLTDSVKVNIVDDLGVAKPNQPVRFELVSGTGALYPGGFAAMTLNTNNSGHAAVAWKLGKAGGLTQQQLVIRSDYLATPLTGSPMTVTATVEYADTLQLTKTDGDQQTGPASGVLSKSLTVRLVSESGLSVPPQLLRFKVVSGEGKVNDADSVSVLTNTAGYASVNWRMGANFRLAQKVLAFLVIKPVHQVYFTATATPVPKKLLYTGLTEFAGQVNKPVNDQLSVRVTDDEANPVANFQVTFKVTAGGGKMNGLDSVRVLTNAEGWASCRWVLGLKSGTRNNQAQILATGLQGSPVRLLASAATGRPFNLNRISGDNQSVGPKRSFPLPLKVQVVDSLQNPIVRQQVEFTVVQGDVQINNASQYLADTDSSGFAVANVKAVNTAGPVQIRVVALYQGLNIKNSPLYFTATVLPPVAVRMLYSGATEFSATVGKRIASPLIVQVTDDIGVAVKGFTVSFRIMQGNGRINGLADSVAVATDDQGFSQAVWELGAISGIRNNQLHIRAGSLSGSPVLLSATALAGRPFFMTRQAGDGQTSVPRVTLPIPLTVQITDSLHNKLSGQAVLFQVQQGDATCDGSSQTTVSTDTAGLAKTIVKFGVTPGLILIKASAKYGATDLQGSPLTFTETMTPPVPTQLLWSGPNTYVGQAGRLLHETLLVRVLDDLNTPIPGHPVIFKISQGAGKVNGQDSVVITMDDEGYGRCKWSLGEQVGVRNNQITIVSRGLRGSPVTVWASGLAPKAFHLAKQGGDEQNGFPLAALALPLQVLVTDSMQYPVAGHPVDFQVKQGDAHFNSLTATTINTDSNGVAALNVNLGTLPGVIRLEAAGRTDASVLQGSPVSFTANLVLPTINRMASYIQADTGVVANGRAVARLTAVLIGQQNQALAGLHLRFGCSGSANTLTQPDAPTTAQGRSQGSLASVKAEMKKIWAQVLYSSVVLDTIRVRFKAGPPAFIRKISGDVQKGAVRLPLAAPLVAALSDSFANPVSAVLTMYEKWPNGGLYSLPDFTTDALGMIRYQWTLGSQAGIYQLYMNHASLAGVMFQAEASTRQPGQMNLISGNDQSGRPGLFLPAPLTLRVLDTFNEPLAGIAVRFAVTSGGGVLYPAAAISTDSLGLAMVNWQMGASGEQSLTATLGTLNVKFSAKLLKNSVPVISCVRDTTVREGQLLVIRVRATDADNDTLTFGAQQLPVGAAFDSTQQQFLWTPGFRHAGLTKVVLWVQDNFGGRNSVIVNINVIDVPAPPLISAFTPIDSLLQIGKENVPFTVAATDPDGNYLYYSWWLNGVMVAPSGTEFTLRYKTSLPSRSTLAVHVSDGQFTVEHVWTLDIQSSVWTDEGLPTEFSLQQNYPNPFNPSTHIRFTVAQPGRILVRIFDNAGRTVATVVDAFYNVGRFEVVWNAKDDQGRAVSSGVYLCTMTGEGYSSVRKIILLK